MNVASGLRSTGVDTGHDISILTRWSILVIIWENILIDCNHIVGVISMSDIGHTFDQRCWCYKAREDQWLQVMFEMDSLKNIRERRNEYQWLE